MLTSRHRYKNSYYLQTDYNYYLDMLVNLQTKVHELALNVYDTVVFSFYVNDAFFYMLISFAYYRLNNNMYWYHNIILNLSKDFNIHIEGR